MGRTFLVNDVLTTLRLSYSSNFSDEAFQILFQYATALDFIEVDGCDIRDGGLVALAKNYRKRMELLGLGLPAAWIAHEYGDRRFEAVANMPDDDMAKVLRETREPVPEDYFKEIDRRIEPLANPPKVFTGQTVQGGLFALSLKNCRKITNRGVRHILRSCVGLWGLNLSGCSGVSLRAFRGPLASLRLEDLIIADIRLAADKYQWDEPIEEKMESVRFPIKALEPNFYKACHDFDSDDQYDYIVPPISEEDDSDSEDDKSEEGEEGEEGEEEE
jgi:hypothetical protein